MKRACGCKHGVMKGRGLGKTMKRLRRGASKLGKSKLGKRVRKGLLKVAADVAVEMIKSGGDQEKMSSAAKKSALKETGKMLEGKGMPFRARKMKSRMGKMRAAQRKISAGLR